MSGLTFNLAEAAAFAFTRRFDAVLKIEIDEQPDALWIDGRGPAPVILTTAPDSNAPAPFAADCIWRSNAHTLHRVLEGERALESAYISGRLRIAGDMSVMARLAMESRA